MQKIEKILLDSDDEVANALAAAKMTLHEAARDIGKRGLYVKKTLKTWDGKRETTSRLNPSAKIARQAIQTILALRNLRLQERKFAQKENGKCTRDRVSGVSRAAD